jgi:hypothetical protein
MSSLPGAVIVFSTAWRQNPSLPTSPSSQREPRAGRLHQPATLVGIALARESDSDGSSDPAVASRNEDRFAGEFSGAAVTFSAGLRLRPHLVLAPGLPLLVLRFGLLRH